METKNLIILCAAAIICVIAVCGIYVYFESALDTTFTIKDASITEGENFKVVLTDENGKALANKTVSLSLSNGKTYNKTTNDNGIVKIKMKKKGSYIVNGSFEGGDGYKSASFNNINITVKEKKKTQKTTSSSQSTTPKVSLANSWEYEEAAYEQGLIDGRNGHYSYPSDLPSGYEDAYAQGYKDGPTSTQ